MLSTSNGYGQCVVLDTPVARPTMTIPPPTPGPVLVDTALPFSTGAHQWRIDTRGVMGPATYQEGVRIGWYYRITPDGQSIFSRTSRLDKDPVRVRCTAVPRQCSLRLPGFPERIMTDISGVSSRGPDGTAIATAYAGWVMAQIPLPVPGTQPLPAVQGPSSTPRRVPPVTQAPTTPASIKQHNQLHRIIPMPSRPPNLPVPSAVKPADIVLPIVQLGPVVPIYTPVLPSAVNSSLPWSLACILSPSVGPHYSDNTGARHNLKGIVSLSCGIQPLKRLSMRATANQYLISGQQQPWDPDISYSITYQLTDHFSFGYGNYSGNRWPWHNLRGTGTFSSGALTADYVLPVALHPLPFLKDNPVLTCDTGAGYTPRYSTNSGSQRTGKITLSFACGATLFNRLTLRVTAIAYPDGGQQPWDPDYTYTASIRITNSLSFSMANYAGNRFPWRSSPGTGRSELDSSFSLNYVLPLSSWGR